MENNIVVKTVDDCLSELGFRGSKSYDLVNDKKGICILIGIKDRLRLFISSIYIPN